MILKKYNAPEALELTGEFSGDILSGSWTNQEGQGDFTNAYTYDDDLILE